MTPDGFQGWVYREDFPNQPFDFLITRNTIGDAPYYRVYVRPADGTGGLFSWYLDASRSSIFTAAGSASSNGSRRYDAIKERRDARPKPTELREVAVDGNPH